MTVQDPTPTTAPGAPLTDGELSDRYLAVPVAAVNDVLRGQGLLHQTLPSSITPLGGTARLAGIAFTIAGAKNTRLEDEMSERATMLEAIHEHAICVWDTAQDDESAQWGEIMTMAAIRRGARGAVVDGGARDTEQIIGLGFPVFARYRTSNGMLGRFRMTGWQTPVRIGTVEVNPGDVIVGDLDGVIVVPRERAEAVLLEAETIVRTEVGLRTMITDGLSPREVVDRGGYF